ncbi:hypothetical protein N7501_007137 [Penicillium viridicatum]|nr:hypothetical protein N7501_007137 [Penicillium viridicatum]
MNKPFTGTGVSLNIVATWGFEELKGLEQVGNADQVAFRHVDAWRRPGAGPPHNPGGLGVWTLHSPTPRLAKRSG